MSDKYETEDLWSLDGTFQHIVFCPRGDIEGVLIDVDGVPAQVVFAPRDMAQAYRIAESVPGRPLTIEASVAPASADGEGVHEVYDFHRLAAIDGQALNDEFVPDTFSGRVVRLNYAKHGMPNGVVLDSGDFIHTRPDGMESLDLKIGDEVVAEGEAQALATGEGWAVEATQVNGRAVKHKHR